MRSSTIIFALGPLAAHAQTLLVFGTNALPDCARSCTAIANANGVCVPPAAPLTNQATYLSCFCQSSYLSGLYSSSTAVCTDVCTSAADLAQIQSWYEKSCTAAAQASVAAGASSTTAAAAASTTLSTITTTKTSTKTSSAAASSTTGSTTSSAVVTNTNPSWWSLHSRWIAMVIVLVVLFAIIIGLGVWLKKRHRRKANAAANLGPPVIWGPPQNQHHSGGMQYVGSASVEDTSKGKGRAVAQEMGESSQNGGRNLLRK